MDATRTITPTWRGRGLAPGRLFRQCSSTQHNSYPSLHARVRSSQRVTPWMPCSNRFWVSSVVYVLLSSLPRRPSRVDQ